MRNLPFPKSLSGTILVCFLCSCCPTCEKDEKICPPPIKETPVDVEMEYFKKIGPKKPVPTPDLPDREPSIPPESLSRKPYDDVKRVIVAPYTEICLEAECDEEAESKIDWGSITPWLFKD